MSTRDPGYTKTGNGWLTSWANKLSIVPFTGPITSLMIWADSGLTAIGWALKGKFASAATTLGTGAVSGMVSGMNTIGNPMMPIYWGANVVSMGTTRRSIQTHARALTENATSFATRPLGMQPTVLRSYPAGIGGIGGASMSGPGQFASRIANERGQDANAMYNNYMRGEGGVHVNQLQSANGRGA